MRSLRPVAAVLAVAFAFALAPASLFAQTRPTRTAGACSFDGLWIAHAQGFTTRIAAGHWRTWSGTRIEERTPPAGSGWLEITNDRLTFDFENGRTGYSHTFAFEDGCDVLHLSGAAEILFARTSR